MKELEKGIVTLCKAAVTGQSLSLPEGFSLEEALPMIRRHNILPLCYEGALLCGIPRDVAAMRDMFREYCQIYLYSEKQMAELERVFRLFEQQGIDYMPLKGCRHKYLYPKPELRPMGDADLLVRDSAGGFDSAALAAMMSGLGYEFKSELDYVLEMAHPSLYIELHKKLFSDDNSDMDAYFADVWQKARSSGGHSYAMRSEDEYIYIFAHFTKHFRNGGIGFRHVLDLWVYRRAYPDMDWEYINSCLEALHLRRFHDNVGRLTGFWFEEAPSDDMAEYLSGFIFSSGSWGRIQTSVLTGMLRNGGGEGKNSFLSRIAYFSRRLFAPAKALRNKYPVLRKAPWLLPVIWIVRAIDKLFFDRQDFLAKSSAIGSADGEYLAARARELDYVGLDTDY